MGDSLGQIASELFQGMRWLESQHVSVMFMESVEQDEEGLAIMNRVVKSASLVV